MYYSDINTLHSYINLTILDFLTSVVIAFPPSLSFFLCELFFVLQIFLTCNLFLFIPCITRLYVSAVSAFLNIRASYWSASSGFRLLVEITAEAMIRKRRKTMRAIKNQKTYPWDNLIALWKRIHEPRRHKRWNEIKLIAHSVAHYWRNNSCCKHLKNAILSSFVWQDIYYMPGVQFF